MTHDPSSGFELPNFKIPHSEKIEWMIETRGWAVEVEPGCTYSIGFPEAYGFPDVAVLGMKPSGASSILELVAEQLASGVEIPVDVEVAGLFDGGLRSVFVTIDSEAVSDRFTAARAWRRGAEPTMVQLIWPDRNGWLPYESGADADVRAAQPVIGRIPHR